MKNNTIAVQFHANPYSLGATIDFLNSNHESIASKLILESIGKYGFENFLRPTKNSGTMTVGIWPKRQEGDKEPIIFEVNIKSLTPEECLKKLDKEIFETVKKESFWKNFK